MFIDTRLLTFTAPEERNVYGAFSCAPTELGLVCDRCSYKHSAPPELTRLVAALPRCAKHRVYTEKFFFSDRVQVPDSRFQT